MKKTTIYKISYYVVALTFLAIWQLGPVDSMLSKLGGIGVGICIIFTATKYSPFRINKNKPAKNKQENAD